MLTAEQEDFNTILRTHEPYIKELARQKMPSGIVPIEVMDLEIDELIQITHYKLWLALRRDRITNMKAYIRRIVCHEAINLLRRHCAHPTLPLIVDEQGELNEGNVLITLGEGMKDPSYEYEQKEMVQSCMLRIAESVASLPPRQQYAIVCFLKDRVDNLLLLIETFTRYDMNIETVYWPTDKDDMHKLKVSLSIARKKLDSLLRSMETHATEISSSSTGQSQQPSQERQIVQEKQHEDSML